MARAGVSRRADVVVIGAGIVGLSIAYQRARREGAQVVVLERGAGVGEGSTLRAEDNEWAWGMPFRALRISQKPHGMEGAFTETLRQLEQ